MHKFIILSLILVGYLDASVVKLKAVEVVGKDIRNDVPISNVVKNTEIITSQDIQKRSDYNIKDLLERSPLLKFDSAGWGRAVDIRGQGNQASTNVKIMVNGFSITPTNGHTDTNYESISTEDIERVEIIPGGSSVLYGGGTSGGVINIITKKRRQDPYASLQLRYGSQGSIDGKISVGAKINEQLFVKFGFYGYDTNKYRYFHKRRGHTVNGGFDYQITDNQYISGDISYFQGSYKRGTDATKEQINKNKRYSSATRIKGGKVVSAINSSDIKQFISNFEYGIEINGDWNLKIKPYFTYGEYISSSGSLFGDEKYGVKNILNYHYDKGYLALGLDYDFTQDYSKGKKRKEEKEYYSPYVYNRYDVTDRFSVGAGVRYEYAKYDRKMPTSVNTKKITTSNVAFEITPSYAYSKAGRAYVKFERGFTTPTPGHMKEKIDGKFYPNEVGKEKYITYEMGMMDYIYHNPITATIFLTDTKDQITYEGGNAHAGGDYKYINLGKTRRWGIELTAEQSMLNGKLRFSQGFSYINSKIKDSKANRTTYKAGDTMPYVPKYKLVLGVDYDISENFTGFVDSKFYGKQKDTYQRNVSAYNVTDLGLRFKKDSLTVTAGVTNIFDTEYYERINARQNIEDYTYRVGDGRQYYLEMKYKF